MTQAVKRACDACHSRKVKCDSVNPCRNCGQAQLSCTYNAIPQKKGPKGSRAKGISELRETQRQTSLSAKVQNRINGGPCAPPNPGLAPTPGFLKSELVKECIAFFFDNLYPQLPILDRNSAEQQALEMEQNRGAYCLLASLSAKVRKGYEYLDSISLNVLATNFFLFACHYGLESHDRSWYYLREASTMIHLTGMHQEDHYMKHESVEASRRRRLFWLVYATERAYALQRSRPLTLQATINLPTVNDDMTDPLAHHLNGFLILSNLFKPFDDTFNNTWSKARHNLSPQYLAGMQKQLTDLVQSYEIIDRN
ncbi:unnamed protein product [Clonostachys rhizophaga]|uniref:Zn(2)-C6 fungal-type domain-containing protein n=1 Tax=Clonostachys rhizophaga TaxID=160324 RepID=A0A9N9V816_9HYPO|nr:unnamed protein product [Clonostachys rhizophaga]